MKNDANVIINSTSHLVDSRASVVSISDLLKNAIRDSQPFRDWLANA